MYDFCKIVQDLLPNYIEKTTFSETNKFLEEHLEQCEKCSKIYNDMKSNIKVHTENIEEEVDYMKKFNKEVKHLKFWKKVLIVIALVIGIIAGIILYRYSVLIKLHKLNGEIGNEITNIHCIEEISERGSTTINEVWKKDDLISAKHKSSEGEETRVWENKDEWYMIFDKEMKYTKLLQHISIIDFPPISRLTMEDFGVTANFEIKNMKLKDAINPTISIKSIEYEGKNCYQIKQKLTGNSFDAEVIYEKETGLPLYICEEGSKTKDETTYSKMEKKYKYEVNTVTDEDVKKPDLNQYEYYTE